MTLGYIFYIGMSEKYYSFALAYLKTNNLVRYNNMLNRAMSYEEMAHNAK